MTFARPSYSEKGKNINHNQITEDKENNLILNPLSANPTKWSNTLKKFVGNLTTNCLSVFDHFVKLALKWLIRLIDRS